MEQVLDKQSQEGTVLICPFCNTTQDNEAMYQHVTYWGEDEAKSCMCECCGKDFWVRESVTRSFRCRKTKKEADDF